MLAGEDPQEPRALSFRLFQQDRFRDLDAEAAEADVLALAGRHHGDRADAEVVNDDGTVKRLPELIAFAREHGLRIVSIEDLIAYRLRTETFLKRVSVVPTTVGGLNAEAYVYETPFDEMQPIALVIGDVAGKENVPVRIQRERPLVDFLGVANGEGNAIAKAVAEIKRRNRCGVIILLRSGEAIEQSPDGKLAPKPLEGEAHGERHGSARERMQRWRKVGLGAQVLRDLGIQSIAVMTTSERQYVGLGGFGIEISETILLK
jgi:3,4-dihydroxy 2-butanone 4-phosphate synthase/GTP cyclohydrolase II